MIYLQLTTPLSNRRYQKYIRPILTLKKTTERPKKLSYLDICLQIQGRKFRTLVYDRDAFNISYSPRAIFASRPRPRAIFHVVHEGIWYFNWFIVLTFEFCACCWRDMVFFCKDRSRIDVESTVSYCSLSRASFVAFPCVYTASL